MPTELETHKRHLAQAQRAFKQNPTPALASAMKRLAGAIKWQEQCAKKKEKVLHVR